MANDVSSVAFHSLHESYLTICMRAGRAPQDLFNGLSFNAEELRETSYQSWTDWARFLDNLERAIVGLCSLPELQAEWSNHTPSLGPFRNVFRLLVSPEQVMRGVWIWSGPKMFRPPVPIYKRESNDIVTLSLRLPAGYKPSKTFFAFSALATAKLPTLLALPEAKVLLEKVSPTDLVLKLQLPASASLFSRLARAVTRDKTKRKLGEALLQSYAEHREDLAALLALTNESRDGVIIERGNEVVSINPAARRILHLSQTDSLPAATRRLLLETGGSDDLTSIRPRLIRLQVGGDSEIWVQVWTSSSPGKEMATITFVRDVTDSEATRRQVEQLQRYASIGETGAILGHEIATTLAAISSDLQWCLDGRLDTIADATTRDTINRTLANVKHAAQIATNLLTPARDGDVHTRQNLGLLVRQSADIAAYVAKDEAITLKLQIPAAEVFAVCGSYDVVLILVNLLKNAIKAAGDSHSKEVIISLIEDPTRIEIIDRGPGLSDNHAKDWGRVKATSGTGGHGLGLLICRRLALKNKARLEYERRGEETVFSLLF